METEAVPAENPLTRVDVLRLIEANGGTARGLDLSHRRLPAIDLSDLDLSGIILREANLWDAHTQEGASLKGAKLETADLRAAILLRANLESANLQRASLEGANLQEGAILLRAVLMDANLQRALLGGTRLEGANLVGANLRDANLGLANLGSALLQRADLQDAYLSDANLEGARLQGADLRHAILQRATFEGAHLAGARFQGSHLWATDIAEALDVEAIDWGDYRLGEELAGEYEKAIAVYDELKGLHRRLGLDERAGHFFFREMECRRKAAWERVRRALLKAWEEKGRKGKAEVLKSLGAAFWPTLYGWLAGHGERPWNVVFWAAGVLLVFAFGYWGFGSVEGGFLDAVYSSAVSFTALGYGRPEFVPQGLARGAAVAESFVGVFIMALFLTTFVRRMAR
ncbi:MAG TPA: pentapeptide repeat-containing protein [Dehalococcoidia bacterium]|nr:pentapeptide repeat-containing protein [Dehalococcoidia bacterium]